MKGYSEPIFISLRTFYTNVHEGDTSALNPQLMSQWTLISLIAWFVLFLIGTFVQCRARDEVDDDETAHLYYYGQDRKETAMYRDSRV